MQRRRGGTGGGAGVLCTLHATSHPLPPTQISISSKPATATTTNESTSTSTSSSSGGSKKGLTLQVAADVGAEAAHLLLARLLQPVVEAEVLGGSGLQKKAKGEGKGTVTGRWG